MSLPGDAERLDRAIEENITLQFTSFIDQIFTRENGRQMDLTPLLGVTAGHLSAIKNGTQIPSFQTFNCLKTRAFDENAFRFADPLNLSSVAHG